MTRLLGIWPAGVGGTDAHEVFFLSTDRLQHDPRNQALLKWLPAYADKAVGQPPKASPATEKNDGMVTRSYRIPPDFLTAAGGSDPVPVPRPTENVFKSDDPFGAAGRNSPVPMRRPNAKDVLMSHGIPFPEGASASFNPATAMLVVRNTPANLELVEAFVGELVRKNPSTVHLTICIVQAESGLVLEALMQTRRKPDQTPSLAVLEKLAAEGKAGVIATMKLETRSGQRATLSSAVEHYYVSAFEPGAPPAPEKKPALAGDAAVTDPAKLAAPAPLAQSSGSVSAKLEFRPAGLRFEIDPVIGPDGRTLDLNYVLEYHFSPPTETSGPVPPKQEGTLQVELPGANFHCAQSSAAVTYDSGMTKLLGVWKPEGVPAFEGKDLLQAAFLRAEIVPIQKEQP